jgi:hypothetical protein
MPNDQISTVDGLVTPAQIIRASGVIDRLKQAAFRVQMRRICRQACGEMRVINFDHFPVVRMVWLIDLAQTPQIPQGVRSWTYRLLSRTSFKVAKEQLSVSLKTTVIRVSCVPQWE